jgi:hypothetical protein
VNKPNKNEREEINMAGQYCIVRGDRSGVFAGIIKERNGREVVMTDVRCTWYWAGAASTLQMANDGVKDIANSKFTVFVPELTVLDAIVIIPCSPEAEKVIREVPIWKR